MKIAIIGGSGVYDLQKENWKVVKKHEKKNFFGVPSCPILELQDVQAGDKAPTFFFLARHGLNHEINPTHINYRANIFALKELGVRLIISISAVGSLQEEMRPGDFVFVDQFIDWTKGLRKRSFFEQDLVVHVTTAQPIYLPLKNKLFEFAKRELPDVRLHNDGTYLCIEGPQFSSRAESHMYRSFGAHIIGMTNVTEAYLSQEAGIGYATIATVTDYDCWKDEYCTLEEIMKVMKGNNLNVNKLLKNALPAILQENFSFQPLNQNSLVTKNVNLALYPWAQVLLN